MRLPLAVIALAACGPSAPAPAPIGNHPDAPPAAATPAPTVRWVDNGFDTERLPAVTRDGALVVLGEVDGDGARGNPNLHVVTVDRTNHRTSTFDVLTVAEADDGTMFDDRGAGAKLRARVARANAILAALAAAPGVVPLFALTTDRDITRNHAQRADGLEVLFTSPRVVIRRGDTVLLDRALPAAWLDVPDDTVAQQPCTHTPYLGTVWLDEPRRIAVITVNYTGTDMCWEPSSRHHVVSW